MLGFRWEQWPGSAIRPGAGGEENESTANEMSNCPRPAQSETRPWAFCRQHVLPAVTIAVETPPSCKLGLEPKDAATPEFRWKLA
jgi:hypothetical protein